MGHKARSGQERPSRGPWLLNLSPVSRRGFWWQKWPPEGPSLGRSPPDPSGPLKGDPEVTAHHGRSLPFPTPCPPKEQPLCSTLSLSRAVYLLPGDRMMRALSRILAGLPSPHSATSTLVSARKTCRAAEGSSPPGPPPLPPRGSGEPK